MAQGSVVHSATTPTTAPRWMTIDDFCRELGVAASTAYKWSAAGPTSGKFPVFRRLPNGSIRIRRDWFDEWLETLGATPHG